MAVPKVKKGMQFRHVIADCNALWEVVRSLGRGTWLCVCVDEPYNINGRLIPSDHAGRQKAFLSQEILQAVDIQDFFERSLTESDRFYNGLPLGQVVHYHNAFGAYIRCEVVMGTDKEGHTRKVLLPKALVGNWSSGDLPHRRDGIYYEGYHTKEIRHGNTFHPDCSTIFESPTFYRRGKADDPRQMPPISLGLPPMSPEEERSARLWRVVHDAEAALHTEIPVEQRILKAYNILRETAEELK